MKAAIIVFPGSNCDRDVRIALAASAGRDPTMVWYKETALPPCDLIVLPGGFCFGDYLRCGALAANAPVMDEVVARAGRGVPILGICNGFQILTEAGLLPGALMSNASLRFICRDVTLRVESSDSPFTARYRAGQTIRVPIAHHDGNYVANAATLAGIEDNGQVAFRYADAKGAITPAANPNGSMHNIAGLFNRRRTVLGLMPHPERMADPMLGGIDGRAMFDGLVEALS